MNRTKREWALWLASQGFQIFKVIHNTKIPASGYSWKKPGPFGMTTDAKRIEGWFDVEEARGGNMSYGVCPNGVGVIIDLDIKDERDGTKFFKELERAQDESDRIFDSTFMVKSPSGGYHLYLKISSEVGNANSFDKKATAIDVRGWGGYVVGPGCTIGDNSAGEVYPNHGVYEAVDPKTRTIRSCPAWIEDEYLKKPGQREERADVPLMDWDKSVNIAKGLDYLLSYPPAIEGQHGDDLTYELAAQMRDFGISAVKCVDLMFSSGWNDKCSPSWNYEDLESVVDNSYRYGQNRPGSKADFMGMALEDGMYDSMMADIADYEQKALDDTDSSILLYSLNEWVNRGMRREYIVPGWLPAHGFTAMNAKRGTGKSTIFLDLALRIAHDMDWHGIPIKEGYAVVYLCGEDDEGLELNTVGWLHKHGMESVCDRIVFADGTPDLMSADNVKRWYEQISKKVKGRKAVVFLDTWQRATSRAGQNKDEDMQLCVHHAEKLAESLGGPLLGAFHPPKHNEHTILGHSIIENTTSAIWQAIQAPEGIKVEVTRIKGEGVGNYGLFHFEQMILDETDDFGKNRSAIIPLRVGGSDTEGSDEVLNEFRQKRMIIGRAIREWININESIPEAKRLPVDQYNTFNVSTRISELAINPSFRGKYLEPLKEYNVLKFGQQTISGLMAEHFTKKHTDSRKALIVNVPLDFEDGVSIGTKTGPKNSNIFVLTVSEIHAEAPAEEPTDLDI